MRREKEKEKKTQIKVAEETIIAPKGRTRATTAGKISMNV